MEILRDDDAIFRSFGQASISMSYPGVIKAFHYHQRQDDIWYFPFGNAQIVLHDMRRILRLPAARKPFIWEKRTLTFC